jgi:hypothetical protein
MLADAKADQAQAIAGGPGRPGAGDRRRTWPAGFCLEARALRSVIARRELAKQTIHAFGEIVKSAIQLFDRTRKSRLGAGDRRRIGLRERLSRSQHRSSSQRVDRRTSAAPCRISPAVCTENSILVDYVSESPNVSGDDRAALLLPDPVRLAVQVEEPT